MMMKRIIETVLFLICAILFLFAFVNPTFRQVVIWGIYLWPVLLILTGAALLFYHHPASGWLAGGATFLLVMIFTGVLIDAYERSGAGQNTLKDKPSSRLVVSRKDYPNVSALDLKLEMSAGNLFVGSTGKHWLEGDLRGTNAKTHILSNDEQLSIQIASPKRRSLEEIRWNMNLAPGMKTNLELYSGNIHGRLDLSDVHCGNLDLKVNKGNLDIFLGEIISGTKVNIQAGPARIRIQIPENTGVKLKLEGVFHQTNLAQEKWKRKGNVYYSSNYNAVTQQIAINAEVSFGRLEITTGTTDI